MALINSQRKLDTTSVTLCREADDICKSCPNLKNNVCENELQNKRIIKMDNEVLKKLDSDKEYNSVELFEKIDEIFYSVESVHEICFNCKWAEKCLFYQKLLNCR